VNTISKLDLVLLGRRGVTARLSDVEQSVKSILLGAGGGGEGTPTAVRPNLLLNSSFEFYDRSATTPNEWAVNGTVALTSGVFGADGNTVLTVSPSAYVSQAVAGGVDQPQGALVLSVAARASAYGSSVTLDVTHSPGVVLGPIYRIDLDGNEVQSAEVPGDEEWYRFWRPALVTGGGSATAIFGITGSANVYLDAAKYEKEDAESSYLEPTAYVGGDWGASVHLRNLSADNIIAGTLTVGGSSSENPKISILDGDDNEIVVLGDPNGGYYGIDVKAEAGLRVSGSGSVEVTGTGSVEVSGGGSVVANSGGDIVINDGGDLEVNDGGDVNVNDGGNINVNDGGDIVVSGGGDILVQDTGTVEVSGTGVVRAGTPAGARVELAAAGLSAYNGSNDETVRIDSTSGRVRVLADGGIVVEDGSLIVGSPTGQRTEVRDYGVIGYDSGGNVVFALNELGAVGSLDIDDGDVVIGNGGASYAWWDNSEGTFKVQGELIASTFTGGYISGTTITGVTVSGSVLNAGSDNEVTISDQGITIDAYLLPGEPNEQNRIKWKDEDDILADIWTRHTTAGTSTTTMEIEVDGNPKDSQAHMYITANATNANRLGRITLGAYSDNDTATIVIEATSTFTDASRIELSADKVSVGDLWVSNGRTLYTNTIEDSVGDTLYFRTGGAQRAYLNDTGFNANTLVSSGNIFAGSKVYTNALEDNGNNAIGFVIDGTTRASLDAAKFAAESIQSYSGFYGSDTLSLLSSAGEARLQRVGWGQAALLSGNIYHSSGDFNQGANWRCSTPSGTYNTQGAAIIIGGNGRPGVTIYGAAGTFVEGSAPPTWLHLFTVLSNDGYIGSSQFSFGGTRYANHRLRVKSTGDTSSYYSFVVANSAESAHIYVRGDGYLWNNRAWAVTSDEKLKEDLEDLDDDTEALMQLKPKRYRRKDDENRRWETGFVAQDIQAIWPDLVEEAELNPGVSTEKVLTIRYTEIIPRVVNGVQRLHQRLQNLREQFQTFRENAAQEVTALKQKTADQERRLAALERLVERRSQ
jgi:hypothetical protein